MGGPISQKFSESKNPTKVNFFFTSNLHLPANFPTGGGVPQDKYFLSPKLGGVPQDPNFSKSETRGGPSRQKFQMEGGGLTTPRNLSPLHNTRRFPQDGVCKNSDDVTEFGEPQVPDPPRNTRPDSRYLIKGRTNSFLSIEIRQLPERTGDLRVFFKHCEGHKLHALFWAPFTPDATVTRPSPIQCATPWPVDIIPETKVFKSTHSTFGNGNKKNGAWPQQNTCQKPDF